MAEPLMHCRAPGIMTAGASIFLGVVPAKAGTHTPRPRDLALWVDGFITTNAGGYGSLLSQGRQAGVPPSRFKQLAVLRHSFAISPRVLREFCWKNSCPLKPRGRREYRAPDAPDSRVCAGRKQKHTR